MQRRDVEMDSSVSSFEIDDFKNSEISAFQRNQRMSDLNSLTKQNRALVKHQMHERSETQQHGK